jgi:hypothetical protein
MDNNKSTMDQKTSKMENIKKKEVKMGTKMEIIKT